jgi:hypothetical protein
MKILNGENEYGIKMYNHPQPLDGLISLTLASPYIFVTKWRG